MTAVLAVTPVALVTLLVGLRGVAAMRSSSDFLVASRRVSPLVNSAAVSGEYLSAASFLGISALVLTDGVGALWYGVGFTAGYVAMLVLVAAPMRRSGALTVPDFAEARLASVPLRRLSAVVVLVIGLLYVVPQFRTAGLVLSSISDAPYWVGVAVAGTVASLTLALGGMRAATYVQAFQFVLKLLLFIVPAIWLVVQTGADIRHEALHPAQFARFQQDTPVTFEVDTALTVPEDTAVRHPGGSAETLPAGRVTIPSGERLVFPEGTPVPEVAGTDLPGSAGWERPLLDTRDSGHPLLGTWAVLVATVFGAMGLPHVLMRFHTSPDGSAARRTAAFTVGLLGVFYLFPGVYGVLAKVLVPELYVSKAADTAVVALPATVEPGSAGTVFTVLLSAGAFAAFLSTSLGLMIAISGAVAHDLMPTRLRTLRLTAVAVAAGVVLLALPAARFDVGVLVTWGFTVAASTFCPLLVLGIWWTRLTAVGAIAGVLTGLSTTSGAFLAGMVGPELEGWFAFLASYPALWSVPTAFGTMVAVSLCGRPPSWSTTALLRLHLDD